VTGLGAASPAHLTLRVPPWLLALQVLVHVTMHFAPDPQVTLLP
jgi:hypothetical protein